MNEERLKVLKMLKEGRITMEEAELLLDALEGESTRGGEAQGDAGERFSQGTSDRARASGQGRGFGGWTGIPEGLFKFDWKLDPKIFESGFREAMKGFEQSMRDFAQDFRKMDFSAGFKEMFGRSSGQATKSIQIPTAGAAKVAISNRWGDMRINGAETHEISGTAAVTAWGTDDESAGERARAVEITHYREDDTLVVRCELPAGYERTRFRVDLDLTLPKELALTIKGMSGDLSVAGLEAGVAAVNLSGDIIAQQSNGIMALESKSGDIEVLGCAGEMRIHTLSGDIDLERVRSVMVQARTVSGNLRAGIVPEGDAELELQTTSGDVRLALPEGAAAELSAETTSGAIACTLPIEYRERSASRISGSLNGGGAKAHLQTKSGDISIDGLTNA